MLPQVFINIFLKRSKLCWACGPLHSQLKLVREGSADVGTSFPNPPAVHDNLVVAVV